MKTLEIKLKKELLIVDENDFDYFENFKEGIYFKLENGDREFIEGQFFILCKGSELTEEIASELADETIMYEKHKVKCYRYRSYREGFVAFDNSIDSFISAVESKGFYWLEKECDNQFCENGKVDLGYNAFLNCQVCEELEEKTFKNPLIFVNNYVQ